MPGICFNSIKAARSNSAISAVHDPDQCGVGRFDQIAIAKHCPPSAVVNGALSETRRRRQGANVKKCRFSNKTTGVGGRDGPARRNPDQDARDFTNLDLHALNRFSNPPPA
jgi:hypothetical protein